MNKTLSLLKIAWLAGFVDGEGYIGIIRQRKKENSRQSASLLYHPYLIIANNNYDVLLFIKSMIKDGGIYEFRRKKSLRFHGNEKPSFQYHLRKMDRLKEILNIIYPYLRIKKEQCKLIINFINARKSAWRVSGKGSRGISSFSSLEETIYQKLLVLNKRGLK
jgi:hypothetical protein